MAPRALSTGPPEQGQLPVEPLPAEADVEELDDVLLDDVLDDVLGEADADVEAAVSGALLVVDGEPEESPLVAAGVSLEEPVPRLSLR